MNKQELKEKYGKKRVPHEWRKTDKISTLITTFFGSGMSPKAPGTMGSLAAAIVAYPLAMLSYAYPIVINDNAFNTKDANALESFAAIFLTVPKNFMIAALLVFFAAIPFVKKAMKDTGTEDPGWIVIDEVCGIFMTFAFIRPEWILNAPWILIIGFALFRFFDILKPLGIHKMEKLPGAWGVMADDLLGGLYAGLVLVIGLVVPAVFLM